MEGLRERFSLEELAVFHRRLALGEILMWPELMWDVSRCPEREVEWPGSLEQFNYPFGAWLDSWAAICTPDWFDVAAQILVDPPPTPDWLTRQHWLTPFHIFLGRMSDVCPEVAVAKLGPYLATVPPEPRAEILSTICCAEVASALAWATPLLDRADLAPCEIGSLASLLMVSDDDLVAGLQERLEQGVVSGNYPLVAEPQALLAWIRAGCDYRNVPWEEG